MTLDTLTRAQAEVSHVRLKNSLAQSAHAFREHFETENELFRTLSREAVALGTSSVDSGFASNSGDIPIKKATASKSALQSVNLYPVAAQEEDIVRLERLNQCCKRVRLWRRQITNPLLQYKQQQQGGGKVGVGGGVGAPKKTDRRMHVTLLMAMIVDIYEQRMFAEVDASSMDNADGVSCSSGGIQESFPEFVVRFLSQRSSSRRAAVDQLHSTVATVLYAALGHPRIRLFGSLCGIDDKFSPPEKIKVFLHILESVHRCKVAASLGSTSGGARMEEAYAAVPMADVVFHNVGITQHVAQQVIGDLFRDNYYWNFRFWLTPCTELKVDCAWPRGVCEELQERALTLAAASRNTLLNALRKIDGDAFLELLVDAWTTRAKQLHVQLERATDQEEALGAELLRTREATQAARMQRRPTTDDERLLFSKLADEFWNAPVPWQAAKIQAHMSALQPPRPLAQLQHLYAVFLAELPPNQRPWEWIHWNWETEWEWGALVLAPPGAGEAEGDQADTGGSGGEGREGTQSGGGALAEAAEMATPAG